MCMFSVLKYTINKCAIKNMHFFIDLYKVYNNIDRKSNDYFKL